MPRESGAVVFYAVISHAFSGTRRDFCVCLHADAPLSLKRGLRRVCLRFAIWFEAEAPRSGVEKQAFHSVYASGWATALVSRPSRGPRFGAGLPRGPQLHIVGVRRQKHPLLQAKEPPLPCSR